VIAEAGYDLKLALSPCAVLVAFLMFVRLIKTQDSRTFLLCFILKTLPIDNFNCDAGVSEDNGLDITRCRKIPAPPETTVKPRR